MTTLGDLIGDKDEDAFGDFDLSEVQEILGELRETQPHDIAHAELIQQRALRGADILSEFMGKMVKTVGFLESKVNSIKNKAALNYSAPPGARVTADVRRSAAEADPGVEEASIKLARAKAGKIVLEKKFDLLIRQHHHAKDIANGLRRTILGMPTSSFPPRGNEEDVPEGYR
jgi:hypothetical protein